MASSGAPAAKDISSNKAKGSIKKALVRLIISSTSLYVIQAFHLCKNGFLLLFSGVES